eukprot:scaffold18397_cov65-Phaeocystis_antarctica.AAC.4
MHTVKREDPQAVRLCTADVQCIASHCHAYCSCGLRCVSMMRAENITAEGELQLEGVGIQGNYPGSRPFIISGFSFTTAYSISFASASS